MKNKMTKDDIVAEVCSDTGYSKTAVEIVLNGALENIIFALSQNKEVSLSGFGTFTVKHRAPRTGRNPHTGEAVPIPARYMPYFKVGTRMKSAVVESVLRNEARKKNV